SRAMAAARRSGRLSRQSVRSCRPGSGSNLQGEITMVVVRVLFPINTTDIEGLEKKMLATAPKYEGLDGLTRKYYIMSEDHKHAGGIYLWESREKAEAWYNAEWTKYM